MICSASSLMLNDFMDEDWTFNGARAYMNRTPNAENGGFSLRKVPDLLQMLHAQPFDELVAERIPGTEDYCFSTSMWKLARTKISIRTEAIRFRMSVQYSPDNNELQLGVHPSCWMGPPGGSTARRIRTRLISTAWSWASFLSVAGTVTAALIKTDPVGSEASLNEAATWDRLARGYLRFGGSLARAVTGRPAVVITYAERRRKARVTAAVR